MVCVFFVVFVLLEGRRRRRASKFALILGLPPVPRRGEMTRTFPQMTRELGGGGRKAKLQMELGGILIYCSVCRREKEGGRLLRGFAGKAENENGIEQI